MAAAAPPAHAPAGPRARRAPQPKLAPRSRPTRPQINELEAILGEFDGNNDLLHAKL